VNSSHSYISSHFLWKRNRKTEFTS